MKERIRLSARRIWLPCLLCLTSAALVKPVQDRIEKLQPRAAVDPDQLYFSSPETVKSMVLGYDSLAADVYWMRAIQYYGRREEAARRQVRYKNLPALLDIVTTLDPQMVDVYRAGSIFLSEPEPLGAGQPLEAIRLLDKGIARLPGEWWLRFDKGFIYFLHLKQYREAGAAWLEASKVPGAPPWLEALAARGMAQGGAIDTAEELWRRQLDSSDRADVQENARNHLNSIRVDEDIWTLEFMVSKFAEAHGAPPRDLAALVAAGLIRFVPQDPSGTPYDYSAATGKVSLSAGTKVRYLSQPTDYKKTFLGRLSRLYDSRK